VLGPGAFGSLFAVDGGRLAEGVVVSSFEGSSIGTGAPPLHPITSAAKVAMPISPPNILVIIAILLED
jgi:hypothetical protein